LLVLEVTSTQASPQQLAPEAQRPPAPHLQVDVVVSQVSPAAQAGTQGEAAQVPPSQTSPAAQAMPHAPQFAASFITSAQPESQQAEPGVQAGPPAQRHWPASHVLPRSPQARPQEPQLFGSVGSAAQLPSQQLWPKSQERSGPQGTLRHMPSRQD